MADRVGQQFGNYRLVALLGQGGFAEVYLGQHVRLTLQAAVKVLHTHLIDREAEHFSQEAETIAKLMHPAIVRILDYDVQDGVPFLVMDYAPNGSLRRRYPKGTVVPLPQIVSHVRQVADALQYAHEQKFIHRDVKPENMLLGRREEVLLSDFGLAALAHSSASFSTQEALGTLAYMAPEQIEGLPRAASDQYALGVVVYEWLCGSRPFEGSMSEVMVQHLSLPPPPLRDRVPTVPIEVEQVLLKALAKDPRQRFASVQDFATALHVTSIAASSAGATQPLLVSDYGAFARPAPTHNLPAHLTPLIGRRQEVAAACTLLCRPEVRLVTLTGIGGVGKTRLALQVATDLLSDFPDGVYFVSLAPISDPALVMPTIAQALEIKESRTQSLLGLLKASLHDKHSLLLLDNFEQVVGAAVQIAELLAACPRLKVIVTSRAALHVRGEQEFAVPPLSVPDPKHLPDLLALSQYEAVALFIQCAQAIKPTFQVTNANAPTVAKICARLDGLPLAIELAAARIKPLPPEALLARLGQRLQTLTGGARDAPVRQQTLRNTIQWSYDLLDAAEQRLFQRLSIFMSGCTLEAIEAVCAAIGNGGEAGQVLDGVASLVDKSLLQQTEQEGEEARFVMLETIREYGLECLTVNGEMEATQQAHAAYYLALAEEAEPHLKGAEQGQWFARLEQEHDNLRAALTWLLEAATRGRGEERGKQQAERALRLGVALYWFWYVAGPRSEGRSFLERALSLGEGVTTPLRARALFAVADLVWYMGDLDRAQALAEESLRLCQELEDTGGRANALMMLQGVAWLRTQYALARSYLEEAETLFKEVGDTWSRGQCLTQLAQISTAQGEYVRARALLEESRGLYSTLGDQQRLGWTLYLLAHVLFLSQGGLVEAQALGEQSLALLREVNDTFTMSLVFLLLGKIRLHQGEPVLARELFDTSLAIDKEAGWDRWRTAEAQFGLARVAVLQGKAELARELCQQSLALMLEADTKELIPAILEGLADIVARQGERVWAARLWGAAEALRETIRTPFPPVERDTYERSVAVVRTQLGEKAFAAAWAEGRAMTLDQALAAQGAVMRPSPTSAEPLSASPTKSPPTYPDGLTAREVEALRLLAQGLTDAQIAEQLVISPRTVTTRLTSIYSKIQVSSRSAATRYAIEHHLV